MVTVGDVKHAIAFAGYGKVVKCRYVGVLLEADDVRFTTDIHGSLVLATVVYDGQHAAAHKPVCQACEYFAATNWIIPSVKMEISDFPVHNW